jgi:prophage regulatory protein
MLVTFKELYRRFGIPFSRQHIYRLQRAGKFPLRRKVGNLNFWTVEEIEAWVAGLWRPAAASQ